jgi:ABC-type lipoprotein release transport system permease subunit
MDCGSAARMLGRPGKVTRFDIDLHEGVDVPAMQQRLRGVLEGTGADVQTPESQDQRIQDLTKGLEIGFRICGAGALVVGLFLVFNTLSVSVAERRHDIGIMRSVGATRGQVRILFLVEALLLGLAGTALGIPLGLGIASFSLGPMQQVLRDVFLPMHARDIEASFGMFGMAMLAGLSTALLAAVIPASQAAAEEPADAVRRVPVTASAVYRLLQVSASLALILLGAVLIALKPYFSPQTPALIRRGSSFVLLAGVALSGVTLFVYLMRRKGDSETNPTTLLRYMPSSFLLACAALLPSVFGAVCLALSEQFAPDRAPYAGLVLILLGTLLVTPLLASFVIRVGQPLIRGVLPLPSRLAADNLVRSPGRTGLVVAALSAGVALMVQTAGVLRSNEDALDAWVDSTLTADLYVSAGGPISATGRMVPMKEAVARHFEKAYPGARAVGYRYRYPDWDGPTGSTKIWLNVFDVEKFYEANRVRPNAVPHVEMYRELHSQPGLAVVSDNFAAMHNYKIGDTVTVPGAHGPVRLRIIGTIVDYSWNRGSIHVDRAHHRDDFAADLLDAYEVYFPPGVDPERAREEVQQSPWGAEHALFAMPQPELREHIRAMARRLYALVYPQQIVVGVVALLGVATALLISVLQRRRELGLLRAAGATRGQILHSVLAEAVLMGLVGTMIGVVVGLPLEWYVVRVLLFEEAGFLFPVCIPWAGALVIAALAVSCATLAGLWPAFQAMRMRIADAIAYE